MNIIKYNRSYTVIDKMWKEYESMPSTINKHGDPNILKTGLYLRIKQATDVHDMLFKRLVYYDRDKS